MKHFIKHFVAEYKKMNKPDEKLSAKKFQDI